MAFRRRTISLGFSNNNNNNYDTIPKTMRYPPYYPSIPRSLKRKKITVKPITTGARDLASNYCEHTWDVEDCMEYYESSRINRKDLPKSKGLSAKEAAELLEKNGPNALPKPVEMSNLRLFFKQFMNLLWILLLVTDVLSLVGYIADPSNMSNLWVTIIIFVMIFGMCCISFKHEREARKVVRGFQNLLPDSCVVLRDGQELKISAEDLVNGDIVWIRNGTKVPADVRLLYCSQLKLETSSITGEAEPNDYQSEAVEEEVLIFDAHNIAFNGSLCVDGEGMGVVIRTGTRTVIGQIADMTTGQATGQSTLEKQMTRFVIFLIFAASGLGLVVFVVGGFVHNWKNIIQLLCNGFLVCAISMVPAGMPATVTSMIALVARRLAVKNVFLKRLDIVETLGSVNIIASDKTGTLTKNVMTVTNLWYHDEFVDGLPTKRTITVSGNKCDLNRFPNPLGDLLDIMTVCNASKFLDNLSDKEQKSITNKKSFSKQHSVTGSIKKQLTITSAKFNDDVEKTADGVRPVSGSPSEVAMLLYADKVVDIDQVRGKYNMVFEMPFNSKRKWHLMIAKVKDLEGGKAEFKLLIKGASEILIDKCTRIATKEAIIDFDDSVKARFQEAYEKFGSNGRRVIGFCYKVFTADANIKFDWEEENVPLNELTFVGVCAIMDPPREESAPAIEQCRSAGIKVFMVTGDHHLTASAIAREIGLIADVEGQSKDYEVITGEAISRLTETEWDDLLKKRALVFARTTPEQKLLIVEQCQKRKLIIAMTGDGVNDSPALKKANIGIAMGSGSDVAKQAADIILMDDNFSSIVRAVREGRMMFDNIKKLLAYVTFHSTPEIWPIVINFWFGLPLGITSLQILSIDLGTEIMPGIAMAKEPMEGDLMKRPPRRRDKVLTSNTLLFYSYIYAGMIQTVGSFLAYLVVFWEHGIAFGDLWMSSITYFQEGAPDFHSNGNSFTADEQLYINRQACSAWQMGIIFGQMFHLLCVRTRRQSIFTHGIFRNWQSIASMFVSLGLLLCMIYIPGVNTFFGGAPIPITCWAVVAVVGVYFFAFNEFRKFCIRRAPKNPVIRLFKW